MPNSTYIKICGITSLADANAALDAGADALGFNCVPHTPRFLGSWPGAWDVPDQLPEKVSRVAIVADIADAPHHWERTFTHIQFYSNKNGLPVPANARGIMAVRLLGPADMHLVERANTLPLCALLLDAFDPRRLGGTGKQVDAALAQQAIVISKLPVILAGGLTSQNVAEAVAGLHPWGVDVSSGVEIEPGRKDHALIKQFVDAVRQGEAVDSG